MKNEIFKLTKMLRATAHGKPWHGESVFQTLENISAEEAATHLTLESHSIWDYVLHIINWREFTIRNLLDDKPYLVELNSNKDWTTITDFSPAAWKAVLELYKKSTDELSEAIQTIDDSKLEEIVSGHKYTFYTLLHGVIQHDIYHSGQIVLLKKMLKTKVKT